jgi:hypothetical protein
LGKKEICCRKYLQELACGAQPKSREDLKIPGYLNYHSPKAIPGFKLAVSSEFINGNNK